MKVLSFVLSVVLLCSGLSGAANSSGENRFVDHGNGVIEDTSTGLFWSQKDSYVDLGKSLNWYESIDYTKQLRTGGYTDWRMPTVAELKTIYEPDKTNADLFGGRVRLDPIFAARGPYNYWSGETEGTCCALALAFDYGRTDKHHREFSGSYGVRAVRQ